MTKTESLNWKKGAILGFYTYMLISAVNYFYYLLTNSDLFSPRLIFWSGLLVAFGYDIILNLKEKRKAD